MGDGRRAHGAFGEDLAARWYEQHGYVVVDRNWRRREGELDLVVRSSSGRVYVFCEVKSRSSHAFGTPAEAVTFSKQRRLRKLAALWLAEARLGRRVDVRFDVAEVLNGKLTVIEDAF